MRAGIRGTFVKTQSRDGSVEIGSEFDADFNGRAVGDRRLARRRAAVPYRVKLAIKGDGDGSIP